MSLLLALTLILAQATPLTSSPQAGDSANTVITVQETDLDRRARDLSARLRCPVCQSQSIEESNSPLAREMRALVREKLAAGESEEDIERYFFERYGGSILLDPRPEGFNLAVYILPAIALIAGITIVIVSARKWLRPAAATAATSSPDTAAPDEPDPDLAAWEEINR